MQKHYNFIISLFLGSLFLLSCREKMPTQPPLGQNDSVLITNFFPDSARIGTQVEIKGKGFGFNSKGVQIFFGDSIATIISQTDTNFIISVPLGAITSKITIKKGSIISSSSKFFTVIPDNDTSFSSVSFMPEQGYGGDTIRLNGHGFGTDIYSFNVKLGIYSSSIYSINDSTIFCSVPYLQNDSIYTTSISIRKRNITKFFSQQFTIRKRKVIPTLLNISLTNIPLPPGDTIDSRVSFSLTIGKKTGIQCYNFLRNDTLSFCYDSSYSGTGVTNNWINMHKIVSLIIVFDTNNHLLSQVIFSYIYSYRSDEMMASDFFTSEYENLFFIVGNVPYKVLSDGSIDFEFVDSQLSKGLASFHDERTSTSGSNVGPTQSTTLYSNIISYIHLNLTK